MTITRACGLISVETTSDYLRSKKQKIFLAFDILVDGKRIYSYNRSKYLNHKNIKLIDEK